MSSVLLLLISFSVPFYTFSSSLSSLALKIVADVIVKTIVDFGYGDEYTAAAAAKSSSVAVETLKKGDACVLMVNNLGG